MEKVNIASLLSILTNLKLGLSQGKQTTEQSNCFGFLKDRIWTYNDDISVSSPNPLTFKGAISAKEILTLLAKLPGDDVSLSYTKEEIVLKAGRTKAGIKIQQAIEMPIDEINIPSKWNKLPKNFISCIRKCIFSAGHDFTEPLLTNIHCKGKLTQSSDNERATRCTLSSTLKSELLIPSDSARFLTLLHNVNEYNIDKEWLHFKTSEDIIFSCRYDLEKYPSSDSHFDTKGFEFVFPDNTKDILEKADVFIEEGFSQDKLVQIAISTKGVFKIRGEGETGWIEESCRIKVKPDADILFSINPQYLEQILKETNTAIIGEGLVWFLTENFEHVVALEG